jgi:hypothetical protein
MTIHTCINCNYSNTRKCDFDKHLLTQKHKNNVSKNDINIVKVDKVDILIKQNETVIKQNEDFDTIRFNFTNCAQTLKIAAKNKETNRYIKLASINTGISSSDTDFYRIGFGYSSPLNSGEQKCNFNIKDIHIQGNTAVPTTIFRPRPEIEEKIETFYIIQSPLSGHIDIGNPDPTSVGSLMHKSK